MKKIYFWYLLILIIVALLPQGAKAQQNRTQQETSSHVTAQQAMDIGYAFIHSGMGSRSGGTQSNAVRKQAMQLVYTGRATDTLTRAMTDCYYVFALQPKGFVIVAADERVEPILGYSYDNDFVVENMPEHVRSWLGNYEQQIQTVTKSELPAETDIQTKWTRLKSGQSLNTRNRNTVGPLLTTTWNQSPYYNAYCPEYAENQHCATGCVATAMAQIINYWGYPLHGRGTHSYYTDYGTLMVNYDNVTYDYANMPNALTVTSTPAEVDAVATLMYHCGVASNMQFGPGASASYEVEARSAFINFFRYSPSLSIAEKGSFSNYAWKNMLRENLDANSPILYSGVGNSGHSFVCDGYDNNDFFHFNFGWGGANDGWYLTNVVNVGNSNYNSSQTALVGIVPDSTGHIILGQMDGTSTFTVDEPLEFYHLMGHNAYTGIDHTNECNNTVIFIPADNTSQMVLDILSYEYQNVTIYDSIQGNQLRVIQSYSNNDLSPLVSTASALTIWYQGNAYYSGFNLNVSRDNGCRMVSNITSSAEATMIHLSWHENGSATQWQVEYGLKGFNLGEGTVVTAHDTTLILTGLLPMREYDIYIRSICDSTLFGRWSPAINLRTLDGGYWRDRVNSQPSGYTQDASGNVYISSAEGLTWLYKLSQANPSLFFMNRKVTLTADIDLIGYKWIGIFEFCGIFDGQGHTIKNMYEGALFRFVENAVVKNIYLINIQSTESGLINQARSSTVMNCFVSGNITYEGTVGIPVGAIVGEQLSTQTSSSPNTVINCVSNCIINASDRAGGIVGRGESSVIRNCYTASVVSSDRYSPRSVLGYGDHMIVENCYGYNARNGNISIAFAWDPIIYRENTMFNDTDSGYYLVTSIYFDADSQYIGKLTDVLNAGVRKYNLPGLRLWVDDEAGINEGMPVFGPDYAVTCPNIQNLIVRNVVGSNGENGINLSWNATVYANAWEVEYRMADSVEVVRIMTNNNSDTIWGLTEGTTYFFRVRPICGPANYGGWSEECSCVFDRAYWREVVTSQPDGFSIDEDGNVTISSEEGLSWFSTTSVGASYAGKIVWLTRDLSIGRYKWTAIRDFKGTFDGGGHTISGLYINELSDYQGLFGRVNGCVIRNVNLDSANVKGKDYLGMLVGGNSATSGGIAAKGATIINCHVSGTVYGDNHVGGLAGYAADVNACSSEGTVGVQYEVVGGLLASGNSIRNSFSRCTVKGTRYLSGGLIGSGSCVVENSYATGNVGGSLYNGGVIGGLHRNMPSYEGYMRNCYGAGTVQRTGYIGMNTGTDVFWGYRYGSVAGTTAGSPLISNCYGLADSVRCRIVGDPDSYDYPVVSDTASFVVMNDSVVLLHNVDVGQTSYDNLLDALNAWVDTYDTAGMFMHWVADTAGVNGGFPMFEEIKYNTISLFVSDSTPHGSVSGAGTYSNCEPAIITATPDYGYLFAQWNDGNTDNPRAVNLICDTAFTAIFTKKLYKVTGTSEVCINNNCDFEDVAMDGQWILQNGKYASRWYIDDFEGAGRALVNSVESNNYDTQIASHVYAYYPLYLTPGQYNYSYSHRFSGTFNRNLRVVLIPVSSETDTSELIVPGASLPSNAINLDNGYIYGTGNWENYSDTLSLSEGGEYRMVFYWHNELNIGGSNTSGPLYCTAVDNIKFYNNVSEEANNYGYVLGSDVVPYLDTVVLTAVPYEGHEFIGWNDGNTDNPRTVVATKNKLYRAVFIKCPETTSLIVQLPESSGPDISGYMYDGQFYICPGSYSVHYPSANGCDSVVNLILCNESQSICANQLPYTYGETTFPTNTVSGLYPVTIDGHESYSYIQVNPSYMVYDTINIMYDGWKYYGNVCFHDSLPGDYQVTLQSSCGCDSVFNIHVVNRLYVTPDGTGDGKSWAHAMGDLQAALNLAGPTRGSVWVAAGTYYGDGVSENAFILSGSGDYAYQHVYGGFAGNEPDDFDLSLRDFAAHQTILDGQHLQRVVEISSGLSVLDGFTIQNGGGDLFTSVLSSGEIVNCIIQGGTGLGTVIYGGKIRNSLICNNIGHSIICCDTITNSTIVSNTPLEKEFEGNIIEGLIIYGNSVVKNCILWDNIYYFEDIFSLASISYSAVEGDDIWGDGNNILLAHNNDGASPDSNYVRFVDPDNGDFRLAYGSACINMGTPDIGSLGLPSVDLQGLPRVMDGRIDMGAYEYTTYYVTDVRTICASDLPYTWNGVEFIQAGTQTVTLHTTNGYDSTVTMNLTVTPNYMITDVQSVCDNELPYTWNGMQFIQEVTQTITLQTVNGCDSTVTLHLTINESASSEFTIVTNESCYVWNGIEYCETGDYTQTLQTADGCDSVVTLHLTIETGINDHNMSASMNVYPNPTSDIVNVELSMKGEQTENVAIQVFDVYGKLLDIVETQNFASLQTTQIDLSRYANGVYFIKAVAEGNVLAVRKVVKNR